MKWNEMKRNEMKWNDMKSNEMNEWTNEWMNVCLHECIHEWIGMNWNEPNCTGLKWDEMNEGARESSLSHVLAERPLRWGTSFLSYFFSDPLPLSQSPLSLSHSISCNWINTLLRAAITGRFATSGCNPAKHKSSNMLKTAFSRFYNAFSNLQLQSCVARDWCLYSSAVPVRFCYFQLQSISCLRQRAQCGLFRTSLIPSLSSSKSGPNTAVF